MWVLRRDEVVETPQLSFTLLKVAGAVLLMQSDFLRD